jgi:hypothetical protein
MSGSINTVTVQISAEEIARMERERRRRQMLRAAVENAATAQVGAAGAAVRGQGAARRSASAGRVAAGRRSQLVAQRAAAIAQDARRRGMDTIAAQVETARDDAALNAVEHQLDDAIDAATTQDLVRKRLDEVGRAMLGEAWRPLADGSARRAGQTAILADVEVDAAGQARVHVGVDAAVPEINGLPSADCSDEDRISRSILLGLASDRIGVVGAPSSGGATVSGVLGLTSTRSRAGRATRSRAEAM